jgi:hypothetical protein
MSLVKCWACCTRQYLDWYPPTVWLALTDFFGIYYMLRVFEFGLCLANDKALSIGHWGHSHGTS